MLYRNGTNSRKECICKYIYDIHSLLIRFTSKGLVSVVFGQLKNALSVTLVSDGAECIRILKSFFIKMTPESLFDRLRREVKIHFSMFVSKRRFSLGSTLCHGRRITKKITT